MKGFFKIFKQYKSLNPFNIKTYGFFVQTLINKGLETLKERGAEIVLVYGDPNYYMRTGFKADHKLKPPHKLKYPEEAWMAQELVESILTKTQGMVQCASSLNSPEYW